MQRADAAAILNVTDTASLDEAIRAYQELITEYQIRLTNAPTSTLKSLYQARLRELEDAKEVFVGGSGDGLSDLPTDHPSAIAAEAFRPPPAEPPARPPSTPAAPPSYTPPPAEKAAPLAAATAAARTTAAAPIVQQTTQQRRKRVMYPAIGAVAGGVLLLSYYFWPAKGETSPAGSESTAASDSLYRSSIAATGGELVIGRVELKKGDYRAAMATLATVADTLEQLRTRYPADTAVSRLVTERSALVARVRTACAAERRVAEKTGGELPDCFF